MKVLILGINGFIGHRLTETILSKTDWDIYGMDLSKHRLEHCLHYSRLHFKQGDITKEKTWIIEQLENCDVVLPLAVSATRADHISDPLPVYELEFEFNMSLIKLIHQSGKRLIFPSTSEVYGIGSEAVFNEDTSNLVMGPISHERWIYASSRQLLERFIFAYGKHRGMRFTLFRPFQWIGPKQDDVFTKNPEEHHIVSHFVSNIIHEQNMILVNGGFQKLCLTYIEDGIEALIKMIENEQGCAEGQIFNIGNPDNNLTIRELAERIKQRARSYPKYQDFADNIDIISIEDTEFYNNSYQELQYCTPSIEKAKKLLHWHPRTDVEIAINNTLDFYLR